MQKNYLKIVLHQSQEWQLPFRAQVEQTLNELKLENQLSEVMLGNQEKQFKFSKANSELLHIKAHDLKHQIAALRKGGDKAEKVLSDLEGTIQNYESVIITENTV